MDKLTLGGFEIVSLPELGLENVVAKVDTGAFSGAVHCTDIIVTDDEQGPLLRCCPNGHDGARFETRSFERRTVTSATGHSVTRYLITTKIVIQDVEYDVTIGISDRSDLLCPVLIGRRFLRQQNMLVDVSHNSHLDPQGVIA